jgi:chromosome segregation ATPase
MTTRLKLTSRVRPEVRKAPQGISADAHQIEALKAAIQECEQKRTVLRSKIARMRKAISDRDTSIKRLYNQTREHQHLQTGSTTTISQLQKNANSLERAYIGALSDLEAVEDSDRFWTSKELEQEVVTFFQDRERLIDEINYLQQQYQTATMKLQHVQTFVERAPYLRRDMAHLQLLLDDLLERKDSYDRARSRARNANATLVVQRDPAMLGEVEASVVRDIEDTEKQTKAEVVATHESNELMDDAINHLNKCYDGAVRRLSALYLRQDILAPYPNLALSSASECQSGHDR